MSWRYRDKPQPERTKFKVPPVDAPNVNGARIFGLAEGEVGSDVGTADVTELRASDGKLLGTFPAGGSPVGIAYDDSSIWVVNYHGNTVRRLRPSDGKELETFEVGNAPTGIVFDGSSMWIALEGANSVAKGGSRS